MDDHAKIRVLVLGSSGMLGSTIYRTLSSDPGLTVFGTVRDKRASQHLMLKFSNSLIPNIDVHGEQGILDAFAHAKPDVVVNCVGIIKQLPTASDHLASLAINSSLPHRLARYCSVAGSRLVHFSTDCVFSGKKGQYVEGDSPDAYDLYGRTKLLGEVEYPNSITLRTSIIGHELLTAKSLIDWFLSQTGIIKGYRQAIFSGLPTIEVARVVRDLIIPNAGLTGLYHLSASPINKYELLKLVSEVYSKEIEIVPDDELIIDRSLNSDRFRAATGFKPKSWRELIKAMHDDYQSTHP